MENQVFDYCIIITTFDRQLALKNLLKKILHQKGDKKIQIVVFDDGGKENLINYDENIKYIKFSNNHGKKKFWYIIDQTFKYIRNIESKYYIYLQDDLLVDDNFILDVTNLYENLNDHKKISLEFRTDVRTKRPNWSNFTPNIIDNYIQTQWVELDFIAEKKLFEVLDFKINPISENRWNKDPNLSSGVGYQLTKRLNDLGYKMYHTKVSLVKHGFEKSKMNINERMVNDLNIF